MPLALSLMLTFLLQPVVAVLHRWGLGYAQQRCWSFYCSHSSSESLAGWR